MSQFYCRENELRKLNKRYAGDKFECIVIYGRRRVGKTALINEFCKDCILRSPADFDAFQSGRCAEHNGRPETPIIVS